MTRKGRKNKRGDQGSLEVEEELSDAKRSNMAASKTGENTEMKENSSTEPSLIEIREMLANIQASIANILKENKSVKTKLTELTGTAAPAVNWLGVGGGEGGLKTSAGVASLYGGLVLSSPRMF